MEVRVPDLLMLEAHKNKLDDKKQLDNTTAEDDDEDDSPMEQNDWQAQWVETMMKDDDDASLFETMGLMMTMMMMKFQQVEMFEFLY